MRRIAREMNLSESVFLLPSQQADVKLRFFTPPGDEIKFCGHATVGALHTIATHGLFGIGADGRQALSVETNAGVLKTHLDFQAAPAPGIVLDCPDIDLVPTEYELADVAAALGLERDEVDWDKPLMLEKTNNYLYLAAPNLQALRDRHRRVAALSGTGATRLRT